METHNERDGVRENVVNAGFVTAAELPERGGLEKPILGSSTKETYGVTLPVYDYLLVASESRRVVRKYNNHVDYRRYQHPNGEMSLLFGREEEDGNELVHHTGVDVVRQMREENDIKVR